MTGAVGTQAALGPKAMEVQATMMEVLGIGSVDVSNQVISRDRYAEYFMFCANVATTLDKIGIELRSLQRTEIGEVEEAFGVNQVGSSTMPHKRKPIRSEQVCGLARIIRSSVEPSLQNNTLWDERDLTNSSCERVLFPEASILTDHCIRLMTTVLEGLVINRAAIRRNLAFGDDLALAKAGTLEAKVRMRSIVPVDRLQVVGNGEVVAEVPLSADRTAAEATLKLPAKRSGWYVLRAYTEQGRHPVLDFHVSATTSPIYVSGQGAPPRSKADADFFLAWVDKLEEASKDHPDYNSPAERETILASLAEARRVFRERSGAPAR